MSVGPMDVSKFSLITMLLLASATASEAMAPPWSDSLQRRGPLVSREEYGPAAGPRLGMARANDVPGGASVGEDHAHAHSVRGLTERAATESDRKDKGGGERSRTKRYFPTGFLGSPPAATSQTPLMVAQANNQDYHYMPLQDDGTVYVLDPCPAPSPPSGGGGSNVFALLTFSVVTANVLINAVANVNSNNNNNNNNDNNNNDNINNENVSSNLDSNTNDNTIMGRALASNASLPDASASCACSRRRRRTPSELPERLQAPQWLMSCVPRLVCESYRSAAFSSGLASVAGKVTGLTSSLIGLQQLPKDELKEAQVRGSSGASCELHYPCSALGP